LGNNSTFLTLFASFCLSAIAYQVAQNREVPVQKLEFDEFTITAGGSDDADDGDTEGIDWNQNSAFWCVTHPDICDYAVTDGGEEQGGYEC